MVAPSLVPADNVRGVLRAHFDATAANIAETGPRAGAVAWRMSCFDHGRRLVALLDARSRPVADRDVLDLACGWGGHAAAFAERGARVVGSDLGDHAFPALHNLAREHALPMSVCQASCEELPYPDNRFDVVLALELIEHIFSVERFAAELHRVLRPDGICILSTPARLRAVVEGEPHYGLRGLALLPFGMQGMVATRVFGKSYPFPITRQYSTAQSLLRPFTSAGLQGEATVTGRLGRMLHNRPVLRRVVANLAWNVVLLTKPASTLPVPTDDPKQSGSSA